MWRRNGGPEGSSSPAELPAADDNDYYLLLKPLSDPGLGEIRITEDLFAVGRNEPPFAAYRREAVAEMSRRHARIFAEKGAVYVADLESKNGTTVNGTPVRQKPQRLKDGDEICFGGDLSFRVALGRQSKAPPSAAKLIRVTLAPEHNDLGLLPIVITNFPFLISKADTTFSRYRDAYPHQVNYVSRRHAHIFLKGGAPFIEDLGSTNGTFLGEQRLDEHAVPLKDGDVIAFGGRHFVYRVYVHEESEATLTRVVSAEELAAQPEVDADKTTFVAAADSFLDIFCIDVAPPQEDEVNQEAAAPSAEAGSEGEEPRSKRAIFLAELQGAFGTVEGPKLRRMGRWAAGVAVVLVALGTWLYRAGAPEREMKELLARGDYAAATAVAQEYLAGHPQDAKLQALGTEALLKAAVPPWLALLKAGDFDRAAAAVAEMKSKGAGNADAQALLGELQWVTDLQRFVTGRGGLDAPIRIFADEGQIKTL